jgi:intracellular sulfur oxidation DsrE/DsrF family protein
MRISSQMLFGLLFLILPLAAAAADASTGPLIEHFGPVYDYPSAGFKLDPEVRYRSVMDVSESPESALDLNRYIESAARFLNMHAAAGVPASNLELAVVLHGSAGKDALSDKAYASRYGAANPNTQLLNALNEAGVKIYLCGQTAGFRAFGVEELNPAVTLATSAMTVLTRLQVEGWALLP